jgi:hypothetical protein
MHPMIYCRILRSNFKETNWNCDICERNYSDKIWSFYCTICNFDMCLSCSRKYLPNNEYINNIGITIDNHSHSLVYMITNRNWTCDLCSKSYESDEPTYYCSLCDYDVCKSCMRQLSDEEKFPFLFRGFRDDHNKKVIKSIYHKHRLIYCMTSRGRKLTSWTCNECYNSYEFDDWSFYCSLCDYDLCYNCYSK